MVWYSHLFQNFPQFIVIHTVKGFGIVSKAEIDVFLELSCFFDDPADIGNLLSGSSAFSKTGLNIWKFTVHVLLKPGLENFELIIREMQIKTIMRYYLMLVRMAAIKKSIRLNAGVEKREPFRSVGGNANCTATVENSVEIP